MWEHLKFKPAVVWSKTLKRGGHRLKSQMIDFETRGSIQGPLVTFANIVDPDQASLVIELPHKGLLCLLMEI